MADELSSTDHASVSGGGGSGSSSKLNVDNAAQVAAAMGFTELVTKSGYMTKSAKSAKGSGRNWKKRYFVLSGHNITYFVDHKSKSEAKGSLLLTPETEIRSTADPAYEYVFEISSEYETLRIAAKDHVEMESWMSALQSTIAEIRVKTTRAYMELQEKTMMGSTKWTKKFFMLHSNSISFHQSHMHTFKALGVFKIHERMMVEEADGTLVLTNHETGTPQRVCVMRPWTDEKNATARAAAQQPILEDWLAAINEVIETLKATETVISGESETTIMDGYLKTKPATGGNNKKWVNRFYALTETALYMAEDHEEAAAIAVYPLNPTCSVFETNLRQHAFELVTTQQALHVQADSAMKMEIWIRELRKVISQSKSSSRDPLLTGAMDKELERYQVHFEEKKPLGIVLERSREWALVKLSNADASEVTEGSALSSINGRSVMLDDYSSSIKRLTGWKPPLTLEFIKGPECEGTLAKLSRGRRGTVKNWTQRYFVVKHGKLTYYKILGQGTQELKLELKGCVQLMGSAISLVPYEEEKQYFCFRLISGVATLIMQAETVEEMLHWATTLYHAIAIANGGGYLIDVERKRQEGEMLERQRQARLRQAEEAAAQRKRETEEAERMKVEREQAALKAQEEAEAARLAAEQARKEAEEAAAKAAADEVAAALAAAEQAEKEAAERAAAEATAEAERLEAEAAYDQANAENQEAEEAVDDLQAEIAEQEFQEKQMEVEQLMQAHVPVVAPSQDDAAAAEASDPTGEEPTSMPEAPPSEVGAAMPPQAPEPEEEDESGEEAEEEVAVEDGAAANEPAMPSLGSRPRSKRQSISTIDLTNLGMSSSFAMPAGNAEAEAAAKAAAEATPELEPEPEAEAEPEPEPEPEPAAEPEPEPAPPASAARSSSMVEEDEEEYVAGESEASRDQLEAAFAILDTRQTGALNPMQFSNLLRAAGVSQHNSYMEMRWYQKFDSDHAGGLSIDNFISGISALRNDKDVTPYMADRLITYIQELGASDNLVL